jgi:chitosanase
VSAVYRRLRQWWPATLIAACLLAGCSQSAPAPALPTSPSPSASPSQSPDLTDPRLKEVALEVVSTAENSTTAWWRQYAYIENIGDQRGYTAGLIGYCSGTGDMLELIRRYTGVQPHNPLARFTGELVRLDRQYAAHGLRPNPASADTHALDRGHFVQAWRQAAADPAFQRLQREERDQDYFDPAVALARTDGLHALGQLAYFDTAVKMGSVTDHDFQGLRAIARRAAKLPVEGGDESVYLRAFLSSRAYVTANGQSVPDRIRVQQTWLEQGNLTLRLPLVWRMYNGDPTWRIDTLPAPHL